jgi:hypothetical protein
MRGIQSWFVVLFTVIVAAICITTASSESGSVVLAHQQLLENVGSFTAANLKTDVFADMPPLPGGPSNNNLASRVCKSVFVSMPQSHIYLVTHFVATPSSFPLSIISFRYNSLRYSLIRHLVMH